MERTGALTSNLYSLRRKFVTLAEFRMENSGDVHNEGEVYTILYTRWLDS